jgi:hypothetical protein
MFTAGWGGVSQHPVHIDGSFQRFHGFSGVACVNSGIVENSNDADDRGDNYSFGEKAWIWKC